MENAAIINDEGHNIAERVVILERDVVSLKKADAVILTKIEKLQEENKQLQSLLERVANIEEKLN